MVGGAWLSCSLLGHASPSWSSDADVQIATFVQQTDMYNLFKTWHKMYRCLHEGSKVGFLPDAAVDEHDIMIP